MAVNATGKTLCSVDFEVFGKVQGKYVSKYLFGLFQVYISSGMISELYIFVLPFFYCNFVALNCFLCFFVSGVFFRKVINIYIYYIDTDEIPGFLLLLKNHIITARSEDTRKIVSSLHAVKICFFTCEDIGYPITIALLAQARGRLI